MQHFSTFLRRLALVSIVFGLLVVAALGVLGRLAYVSHNEAKAFRDGWQRIHETKDELLLCQGPDSAGDWTLIEHHLGELEALMRDLPALEVDLDAEKVLAARGASDDVLMQEYSRLQGLEETFQERFFETQETEGRMLAATILLQLMLIAGVMAAFLYSLRYNTEHRATLSRAVERLHDVVAFKREPHPLPEARWREEADTLETIEAVANQILTDRRLSEIGSSATLEQLVEELYGLISRSVPCDRVAMAFIDPLGNVTAESAYTVMDAVYLDPGFTEQLSNTTLGRVAESGAPRIINDLSHHYAQVHQSRPTEWLLQEGLQASITAPMYRDDECVGFMFCTSRYANSYTEAHAEFVAHITRLLKDKLHNSYQAQQVISKTAEGFVTLTREKDKETSNHIVRMSRYSYIIAKQLFSNRRQLTPKFMRELLWFSRLHDIGKIGIPDAVLSKPGKLTAEEWEQMQQHVAIGEGVIGSINQELAGAVQQGILDTALDVVAHHHERWDGTGYPRGLAGEEISIAGRIVAVADVFDALSSSRPYKRAFDLEHALSIMREERGKHFDPEVLDAFLEALPAIEKIRNEFSDD